MVVTEHQLLIGEVAHQTGVSREAIRYYERLRLLQKPQRSRAGYRLYSPEAVARVHFIKRAQQLGFSLEEIRRIIDLSHAGRSPCSQVRQLLQQKRDEVDRQIRALSTFRQELDEFLKGLESVPDHVDSSAHVCGLIERVSINPGMKDKTLRKEVRPNGIEEG